MELGHILPRKPKRVLEFLLKDELENGTVQIECDRGSYYREPGKGHEGYTR
ncbi:hypothetical protein DMNBHIDG_01558 [Candidatus Methanoperedenaceae archaeon GB37]|nr:hypothetical protein DMNBHIDG_01558 [Candidatus Methanoperedenaceae archaeon GB37]